MKGGDGGEEGVKKGSSGKGGCILAGR